MRKKRYIEELSEKEEASLKKGYKSREPYLFRRKCHCILESNAGKDIEELRIFFGVRRATVTDWFNRWEKEGIEGLKMRVGRGRPRKLNTDDAGQVKRVKELVENDPQNLNRVLDCLKSEYEIEKLSKKTLQRFLKNLNTNGNDSGRS